MSSNDGKGDGHQNDSALSYEALKQLIMPALLTVILGCGVLFPSIWYSTHLSYNSSADDVLVACSISLFSSVMYLWVLHSISVITLREPWVSKAIFGAAIGSILATSAVIYKQKFTSDPNPFPLQGRWEVRVVGKDPATGRFSRGVFQGSMIVAYNRDVKAYTGYSLGQEGINNSNEYGIQAITHITWRNQQDKIEIDIKNFPRDDKLHKPGNESPETLPLTIHGDGTKFTSDVSNDDSLSSGYKLILSRAD